MISAQISAGLAASEFEPFFQPMVAMTDGRFVGFEALARWRRPGVGLVAPVEFVPAAEMSGLIRVIDLVILERAWRVFERALTRYPRPGTPPVLSVNLSAGHFLDGAIVDRVGALLAEGLGQVSRLQFEITETRLITDKVQAEKILQKIRALGVSIALDDFGTGYSSLVYLHRFPIDCIKIDRSFSEAILRSPRSRLIVQSIINLAQLMDIRMVAEGVEEKGVADALLALGCKIGQGMYFNPPLPEDGLIDLLST